MTVEKLARAMWEADLWMHGRQKTKPFEGRTKRSYELLADRVIYFANRDETS